MSSEGLCRLPELPRGIRVLTTSESERLQSFHPRAASSIKRCPTCSGSKQFRWYDPYCGDEVATYECPCEDQLVLHRYLLWSGIGTAYQRLRWADATGVEPGALDAVQSWLVRAEGNANAGFGLLLTGNRGTGKTLLGILMLKNLLAQGYEGYFTTFSDLITMLISGWQDGEAMRWYHAMCRNSPFLVVDDVGREIKQKRRTSDGEWRDFSPASAEFALESLLRHRVAMGLPTILTTNLSVTQLTQHYGEHFKSLLTEVAQQYEFVGGDYRPQAQSRLQTERDLGLRRPVTIG